MTLRWGTFMDLDKHGKKLIRSGRLFLFQKLLISKNEDLLRLRFSDFGAHKNY